MYDGVKGAIRRVFLAFGGAIFREENLETIGSAGLNYEGSGGGEALRSVLKSVLDDPEMTATYRERASERAHRYYTWEAITDAYEALFYDVLAGRNVASTESAVSTPRQ